MIRKDHVMDAIIHQTFFVVNWFNFHQVRFSAYHLLIHLSVKIN